MLLVVSNYYWDHSCWLGSGPLIIIHGLIMISFTDTFECCKEGKEQFKWCWMVEEEK